MHPWIYVLENSSMTTDDNQQTGTETCAFRRDFETSLSDIPLKTDTTLTVMTGYKMYLDKQWASPLHKGYSGEEFMEWVIIEGSTSLAAATALTLMSLFLTF